MVLGLPREYTEEDFRLFIEPYLHAVTSLLLFDARAADRSDVSSCRVAVVDFADGDALAAFASVYNNLYFPGFRDVAPCIVAPLGGVLEGPVLPEGLAELPACAVCLRRLQCSASGLDPVGHTPVSMHFAGNAARCLACRVYADRRESRGAPPPPPPNATSDADQQLELYRCVACGLLENVWLCLVCAHTGCGRYTMRHAEQHFRESQHAFSLELATGRIWDYQRDTFVHFDGDATAGRRSSFGGGQEQQAMETRSHQHHHSGKGPAGGDVAKYKWAGSDDGAAAAAVPAFSPGSSFPNDDNATRGYMDLTAASAAAWDAGADAEGLRGKMDSLAGEYEQLLEGQLRDQQLHFQKILARETILAIEESIALQRHKHPAASSAASSSSSSSFSASAPATASSSSSSFPSSLPPLDPSAVAALDAQLAALEAAKVEVSLLEQEHASVLAALAQAEKDARQARKGNDALARQQQALRERAAALETQAAADKARNDLQVAELQSQVRGLALWVDLPGLEGGFTSRRPTPSHSRCATSPSSRARPRRSRPRRSRRSLKAAPSSSGRALSRLRRRGCRRRPKENENEDAIACFINMYVSGTW